MNADQADTDNDTIGDVCDTDSDGDGVADATDNCDLVVNANQLNTDGDAFGDLCDADDDNDSVADGSDNCALVSNVGQLNTDGDAFGDACDSDRDNDTVTDASDNCPLVVNADQLNTDGDAAGNVCDTDDDNDTVLDGADNCALVANANQLDTDSDTAGNVCDADDDGDGVSDVTDNCALVANADQLNTDGDAFGDVCDTADNPLSLWRLDESQGATVASDSRGTNDGTYLGGVALGERGAFRGQSNTAARFNGGNYVHVARQISGDFSIEFWFNTTTPGASNGSAWYTGTGLVDAEMPGGTNDFGISLRTDGRVLAGVGNPDVTIVSNSSGLTNGVWHQVVFTRAQASGEARLYIDGELDASPVTGGTQPLTAPSFIDFGRIQTGIQYYVGLLDEVAVHTTVLSSDDVRSHYQAASACGNNVVDNRPDCDDDDNDGVVDGTDNCPLVANVNQLDADADALGDVCDPDDDNDGVLDGSDICVGFDDGVDADADSTPDGCDACPANPARTVGPCPCPAGYVGAACDQCDTAGGFADVDANGTCEADCVGGGCDALTAARGLSTGNYAFDLLNGPATVYVDGSYDGGAWILIGRGREDWAWTNTGIGLESEVSVGVGTSAAFAPKYLSTATVESLIALSAGPADLRDVEVRLRRAANPAGSNYQEVRMRFLNNANWNWDFPNVQQTVSIVTGSSDLGGSNSATASIRDVGQNNHSRVFTWDWSDHNRLEGFSYGQTVNNGDNTGTSYLWEFGNESHAIPYTEVYIRLPICTSGFCNGHGTCDASGGLPACTSCNPSWAGTRCEIDTTTSTSCLALHNSSPTLGDGTYTIDPDGAGALPSISVQCDMTTAGGGWTVIDNETFASGSAPGWPDVSVITSCTAYGNMLGLFANDDVASRTYDLLSIPHSEALVSLDYVVLDTWDGESAFVDVDGARVYSTPFTYGGTTDLCGGGWADVGPQPVSSQAAHTTNSLLLQISSTLDQGSADESFGVDDVRVMVR